MEIALSGILKGNAANPGGLSTFRLYFMRLYFLLLFAAFGKTVWTEIVAHVGPWDPLHGVAFSFWAALSLLAVLGLRYPLKMVPLPLLQFVYKSIWMILVAYPLWNAGQLTDPYTLRLTKLFLVVMVIDLLVIPWPYMLRNYVFGISDPTKST